MIPLKKPEMQGAKFSRNETFTFEPLGVALPANDVHLINWVENFFMMIQGNGTLEKLTKFWFTNPSWMKELP
jgi:ABC-type amino acid transport substrate-binding protein